MDVLLCAGSATNKIATAVRPRFKSGGVTLVTEDTINNIQEIIDRGEYFDRAVIMEQGLPDMSNEATVRSAIASFVRICQDNGYKDTSYVFVSSNEELAAIIFEETLSINNQRVVLLNKSQLTVNFSIDCCVKNLKEFEERLVFSIDDIEDNSNNVEIIYSQEHTSDESYNVDSSSELKQITEISFDEIEEVPEEVASSAESNAYNEDLGEQSGLEVSDFDDLYEEADAIGGISFDSMEDDFSVEDDSYSEYNDADEDSIDFIEMSSNNIEETKDDTESNEENSQNEGLDEQLNAVEDIDFEEQTVDTIVDDTDNEIDDTDFIPVGEEYSDIEYNDTDLDTPDEYDRTEDILGQLDDEIEVPEDIISVSSDDNIDMVFDEVDENHVCHVDLSKRPLVNLNKPLMDDGNDLAILDSDVEAAEGLIYNEDEYTETDNVSTIDNLFQDDPELVVEEPEDEIVLENTQDDYDNQKENTEQPEVSDVTLFGVDEKSNIPEMFTYDTNNKEPAEVDTQSMEVTTTPAKKQKRGLFSKRDNGEVNKELENVLKSFKNRGNSLVITGTRCSGVSTIVNSLANLLVNMDCTVLIVDLDIKNRAQAFISKDAYDAVHSLDAENSSIKQALNAVNNNVSRYINIVKPGLHVLTMGLAGDVLEYDDLAPKTKLARFSSNVRNNYNFIIYDIPFDVATGYAEDIIYTADNVVIACEKSTHGIMNTMLSMCNIENDEMLEAMFCKTQICFTKSKEFNKLLGVNVRNNYDILKRLDAEVESLLGIEPEYRFSDIDICGDIAYNTMYEDMWFSNKSIVDNAEGKNEYLKLINKILIKR